MKPEGTISGITSAGEVGVGRLLALAADGAVAWSDEELGALLAQQLTAPLAVELDNAVPGLNLQLTLLAPEAASATTLGKALFLPQASAALLELVKDYAKAASKHPACGVPSEVALVLYYTAIAVAMARRAERITRLTNEELRRGISQVLGWKWLTAEVRDILTAALAKIRM